MNTEQLITHGDACKKLHVNRQTLYKLRRSGELQTVKIGGKVLIPENSIQALIKRKTR